MIYSLTQNGQKAQRNIYDREPMNSYRLVVKEILDIILHLRL